MTQPPDTPENPPPRAFWTWDIILLVVVNVAMLTAIGIGLVIVMRALGPALASQAQKLPLFGS